MDGPNQGHTSLLRDQDIPLRRSNARPRWSKIVKVNIAFVSIVLCINVALLVWTERQFPAHGNHTVYTGTYKKMETVSTWAHLGINVLATCLLGASSSAMQCLLAPTRKEINRAHSQKSWLDVGVTGFRNFRRGNKWRSTICALLVLSSLPLHLLYNSVVFTAPAINEYFAVLVSPSFFDDSTVTIDPSELYGFQNPSFDLNGDISSMQQNVKSLVRLDNLDCIHAYYTNLVTGYRNVLLVTNPSQPADPILNIFIWAGSTQDGNGLGWVSSDMDWVSDKKPDNWTFQVGVVDGKLISVYDGDYYEDTSPVSVQYCLAQIATPLCRVRVNTIFLGVVILCNIIKLICLITILCLPRFDPLITIGDAIATFLDNPDPTTTGLYPLTADEVEFEQTSNKKGNRNARNGPSVWKGERLRWLHGVNKARWRWGIFCVFGIWLASFIFVIYGRFGGGGIVILGSNSFLSGFGQLNLLNVLGFSVRSTSQSISSNVLMSNLPQLLISILYILYNGLLTSMLLSAEFTSYGRAKKSLRTSTPRGQQRGTYFLQIPFRYGLPLMLSMTLLHWLVSQSIFLAEVDVYDPDGNLSVDSSMNATGYSLVSLVFVVIVGAVMVGALAFLAFFRRYDGGVPLVRSCSRAISAACHPTTGDDRAAFSFVQYGVLGPGDGGNRHVGFGSKQVMPLVAGQPYNGSPPAWGDMDEYEGGVVELRDSAGQQGEFRGSRMDIAPAKDGSARVGVAML